MSTGPPTTTNSSSQAGINDDLYRHNQRRIEQLQKVVADWSRMNEEGNRTYHERQNELQRKIREGDEARCVVLPYHRGSKNLYVLQTSVRIA